MYLYGWEREEAMALWPERHRRHKIEERRNTSTDRSAARL